jgi:hypothetical protein
MWFLFIYRFSSCTIWRDRFLDGGPANRSAAILPHIPNDGLAALIHVHMLDTHKLGAALAQAPESLDLCNIGPH